jgi:hypothetical protein
VKNQIQSMSPELIFWFMLVTKMAVTALFVSFVTITAERLGTTAGALIATLPVSAGPVYVLLAVDHDSAFISMSAVSSLALNAATAIFITVYVLFAQQRSLWFSVSLALAAWLATAVTLAFVHWTGCSASVLNVAVLALCLIIVEPFRHVRMLPKIRSWHAFAVRATMVTLLVGAVVVLSFKIGPAGSGALAMFPVVSMSIMVILHRVVGGPATAALLANAIFGLAGFGAALLTLHLTAVPFGSSIALIVALGVSVCWNATIYATRRRHRTLG